MSHYVAEYEVGEIVAVRTTALDPFKRNQPTVLGLVGTLQAYAPSKDPENVVGDRATPDETVNFAYTEGVGYVAYVDTSSFVEAGTWTLRMHLYEQSGGYGNVEYATFILKL